VGQQASGAILYAVFQVCTITTALFAQSIKRTITEQTIEVFKIVCFVTGEIGTRFVLEESMAVFHLDTSNLFAL
jgi:hypothetical protein